MRLLKSPPFMFHRRTNTPTCAIDTYTTSPLSNSIVAPQPAVSLDLKGLGITRLPCYTILSDLPVDRRCVIARGPLGQQPPVAKSFGALARRRPLRLRRDTPQRHSWPSRRSFL